MKTKTQRRGAKNAKKTQSQHTPGPWKTTLCQRGILGDKSSMKPFLQITTDFKGNGPQAVICEMTGSPGFKMSAGKTVILPADDVSNARLIAAAPEMLEALQDLLRQIDGLDPEECGDKFPGFTTDRASSAIAKAKGSA